MQDSACSEQAIISRLSSGCRDCKVGMRVDGSHDGALLLPILIIIFQAWLNNTQGIDP